MALYEGLKQGRSIEPAPEAPVRRPQAAAYVRPRAPEPAPWRSLRAQVNKEPDSGVSFMDRFLGAGSGKTLEKAGGALLGGLRRDAPAPAPAAPKDRSAAIRSEPRMQVVGAGEAQPPQGRKGIGRAFLIVLAMAFACAALRPWQKAGLLKADWSALFKVPAAQDEGQAAAQALALDKRQDAEDAAKLAALPLQAGTGKALGLWRDSAGRWWRVDGQGALAPCLDPSASENLGLPEIRGVAAHAEAYRGGRRLLLGLPAGMLAGLLPLRASVASEVQAVVLEDPAQPVLLTLDGARCLMGSGDWGEHQRQLALVLADLAARRRRASQIDLRFDGTAVVRPL